MLSLDLIIFVPLAFAVLCPLAGRWNSRAPRVLAAAAVLLQGGFLLNAAQGLSGTTPSISGVDVGVLSVGWSLRLDGLSLPLLALTVVVGLLAIAAAWNVERSPGGFHSLLLVLQAALAAVFLADSLILFYIAWESVLVPMFFLIGSWGSSDARRAAMKFLVYTFAGGAVLLVGVIAVIVSTGSASISAISAAGGVTGWSVAIFWLLAAGFLVKLPVVPVHTWLPDAHTEAPTAGSILLAGLLLKMGGYGLIRVALPLAPAGFEQARVALFALGVVGIVWGAATALVQTDLKRLIAYSSVAHMGFVAAAIATATQASLAAAVLVMISHGLVAGVLFFLVGALYERAHTRELALFGGLGVAMPRWSVAFVFACLASAGLPGLSGFPGEYVTFLEGFSRWGWWMTIVGLGIVLAAAYNLRAVRATVQGPPPTDGPAAMPLADLDQRETLAVSVTAVLIVVLGVAPWLITAVSDGTLSAIAAFVNGGA